MKGATCVSAKNELIRQGGVVGHMLEDEDLGQWEVLDHQSCTSTKTARHKNARDCLLATVRGPMSIDDTVVDPMMQSKGRRTAMAWTKPHHRVRQQSDADTASGNRQSQCRRRREINSGHTWFWERHDSPHTVDRFQGAGQQQGFVGMSGRWRTRSAVTHDDDRVGTAHCEGENRLDGTR